MTRLPTPGGDDSDWGAILNEFLLAAHNHDGSLTPEAVGAAGAIQSGMDAGGDLMGTFPNPVVNSLGGVTINTTSTPAAGQVLTADNEQNASWADAPGAGPSSHYLVVDNTALTVQNQTITPTAGGITRLIVTGTTWQANTSYDVSTALIDGNNGDFYIPYIIGGLSDSVEPTWPTDGSTIDDGAVIEWEDITTQNNWPLITWSANTNMQQGQCVIGDGYMFQSNSNARSGGSQPNWSSDTTYGGTIIDSGVQWSNIGPVSTWAANTHYTVPPNSPSYVVPPSNNGHFYELEFQSVGVSAQSGSTTPAFQTSTQGGNAVYDGDLSWGIAGELTISLASGTDYENAWLLLPASGPDFTQVNVTVGTGSTTVGLNQFIEVIYSTADSQWFSLA